MICTYGVVSNTFRKEDYSNLVYSIYVVINTIFLGPKRTHSDFSEFCLLLVLANFEMPFWAGNGSKLHDIISRIKIVVFIWLYIRLSFPSEHQVP